MLSKEAQKKLLKALGVPEASITDLVDSEDQKDADVPAGVRIYADDATFQAALENNFNTRKRGLNEIFIKDLKAAAGVEFDGKTPEKFLEGFKAHILAEANVSVEDKVKQRDTTIQELRAKLTEKDANIAQLTGQVADVRQDSNILRNLPKDRDDRFSDEDYLHLIKNKVKFTEDNGTTSMNFNGKLLQDEKLLPLPLAAGLSEVFKESKWLKEPSTEDPANPKGPASFGGTDSQHTGLFKNTSEVMKHLETKGINIYGEEAQAILNDAMVKNPAFVV